MNLLRKLFSGAEFLPHGSCYTWDPVLIWLHVISDGLIALAYFTIPLTLVYLVHRRKDLTFNWVFLCFAVFIVACGATHVMEIWNIWRPLYWLAGTIKVVTALASVATAILLVRLIPQALALPSAAQLRAANQRLEQRTVELARSNVELKRLATARQRAEEALKESDERFRLALNGSHIAVFNHDRHLRYSWIYNPIFGYPAGECLGRTDAEILGGEESIRLMALKQRVLDSGVGIRTETSLSAPDGLHYFDLTVEPLRNLEGTSVGITCASTDITGLRRSEQRAQERSVQLEAANRELEAFSYSISHDLRAPLRSMAGFSQILLEDYGDKIDARGRDNLRRVRAAGERMTQLIEDLLGLAKVTRSELQLGPVNLSELACLVVGELQAAEPERRVELVIEPDVFAPSADARLLRIVFENLFGNSWKFVRKQAAPKIEFGATERDGSPVWHVRDNGAGFSMGYAHKLFGAFQRLHTAAEFPGTGIGLATVQRIIHRHGGRVWAEGAVGQGATFYFTLPSLARSKEGTAERKP